MVNIYIYLTIARNAREVEGSMNRQDLISAIEAYADRSGFTPETVCQYAIQHRGFYRNVKTGGDFRYGTAVRLMNWLKANADRVSKRRRRVD